MFFRIVRRSATRSKRRGSRRRQPVVATFGSVEWARRRGPVLRAQRLEKIRARNAAKAR